MEKVNLTHRISFKYCLSILAFMLTFTTLNAQTITQKNIQFDKGSTGITITESIKGYQIIDYVLNLQKGQIMNASMATDNTSNYFNIMEPNEEYVAIYNGSLSDNMYEGQLQKSGNYKIRVYLMRSSARRDEVANFRLEINASPLHNTEMSHDAKVKGTIYHATGQIPCTIKTSEFSGNCNFGVERFGNGNATVFITMPNGKMRIIYFKEGKAIGYKKQQEKQKPFKTSKNHDVFNVSIGNEHYEIPDAVIFGG